LLFGKDNDSFFYRVVLGKSIYHPFPISCDLYRNCPATKRWQTLWKGL